MSRTFLSFDGGIISNQKPFLIIMINHDRYFNRGKNPKDGSVAGSSAVKRESL
jgi:hypothetical protein